MRLFLTILLLCGGMAWAVASKAADPLLHDFEDEAPPEQFAVEGGRISISGNRYKTGHHSLAWDITDSLSSLIYRNAEDFAASGNSRVLALWFYMPQPSPDTLGIELIRDNKVIARGWFGLNFRGWRPLGAAWTDLGCKRGDAVDAIRLTVPENLAGSRVYIDGFCVDARVAPPRPDDQQSWAGCAGRMPEAARTFHTAMDLAFNRPWLPTLRGADELTDSDRQIMERAGKVFAIQTDRPVSKVNVLQLRHTVTADYELDRRDGVVIGRAIISGHGFHEPKSGILLSQYLNSVHDAAGIDELRGIWLDLVIHLSEQGFAPGNANAGEVDDVSGVASLLAYPQDIDRIGRLPDMVDTTIFLLLGERELAEKPAAPPSDWPARLRTAFAAATVLPPSPQKLQRLHILARYFDRCAAAEKGLPASPEMAGQLRKLGDDIAAAGLRATRPAP